MKYYLISEKTMKQIIEVLEKRKMIYQGFQKEPEVPDRDVIQVKELIDKELKQQLPSP